MSKKCPKCDSSDVYVEVLYPYHSMNLACCRACGHLGEEPEFIVTTVFETITASPEVLAPRFIYTVCTSDGEQRWCSALLEVGSWFSEAEAIAATVEWLKEVGE